MDPLIRGFIDQGHKLKSSKYCYITYNHLIITFHTFKFIKKKINQKLSYFTI